MTTLPEQASKGEKGKSKYQCLDINNLYQVSRGESLEQHAAKSTVPRKHGMQLLGKVPAICRRPVNLPSLKAETTGSDTTVSLAPSGPGSTSAPVTSQTWGKTPTTSDITTPPTQSVTALSTPTTGSLTPHQAAIALPVSTTIPVQPPKGQPQAPLTTPSIAVPVPVTQSHDKSWSAVMIGSDLPGIGQPPPYQSPQFQHEFPSLSGAVTEEGVALVTGQKGGADTQYGPGPSLRPQTEGSWMQGGCGAPATEAGNSVLQGSAPVGHNVPQAPPSQFRVAIPSFMYRGNFPQNSGPNGPVNQNQPGMQGVPTFHQVTNNAIGGNASLTTGQQTGTGGTRASGRIGPAATGAGRQAPVVLDELAQRPIIKEEDLNRMDDMTRDAGWAMHDEIDYNQKIAFSDDEVVPDRERRTEGDTVRHTLNENDKPVDERHVVRACEDDIQGPRMVSTTRAWSQYRSKDSRSHGNTGGNTHPNSRPVMTRGSVRSAEDDELWEQRRRNQQKEVELACVRAKQRREEEDKRFKDTREGANKKLQELEKKIEDKKTLESKTFDESQGTIDPASVPPQAITPVPIPVPDWHKERENRDRERENRDRDRERDDDRDVRDDDRDMLRQQRNSSASDFKRLTQIEGRCVMRNVDKDRDRENRKRNHDVPRTEREREREVRDGANFSRQFQMDLPPRFKKPPVQNSRNPSSQIGGSSFAQQYDPRRIQPPVQQAPSRRNRNDSDVDLDDERREMRRDRPASDDGRRRSSIVHRSYGEPPARKPSSNDGRDSREREIGSSRDDRYRDEFKSNFRVDDYDYRVDGGDVESDRERRDREIRREDRSRAEDKRPLSDSYDDHDRDIGRQDCKERREERNDSRREIDRIRNDDRRHQFDRDEYERKDNKEDRARDIDRVPQRDDKYVQREERPQRPDSRDSRVSRESRQSRDSARESEPREYCGLWADEKAPFETDEKRKDRFCEEKDWRGTVPGPITRKKIESDELRNERRNATRLKRSSSGIISLDDRKSDTEKSDEKTERKQSNLTNDVAWNIEKKESTPLRSSTENIQKVQSDTAPVNSPHENIETNESSEHETTKPTHEKSPQLENEEEFVSEIDNKRMDKEQIDLNKEDKRAKSMNQRGSRDGGRNNKSSNWGNGSYSVYRGNWGGSGSSSNGRRPPRMSSQRSSGSREFRITDSEPSGDEISASTTESSREERGPRKSQRSPKPMRKIDKEEKNREIGQEKLSATGSGSVSSERRYEKQRSFDSNGGRSDDARDVFVPRGEPSRRGRGGFRSRGPVGKRIDGYGPPSSKSPFGAQRLQSRRSDIDNEKGISNNDITRDIFGTDEKNKHGRGTAASATNNSRNRQKSVSSEVPPRMQKKSDGEQRRDGSKNSRGTSIERKRCPDTNLKTNRSDGGDEGWETTSNNSDTENERREMRKVSSGSKNGGDARNQSARGDVSRRQSSTNSTAVNGPSSNQNQNGNRPKNQNRQTTSKAPGAEKRAGGANSYQSKNSGTQNQPDRQNSNGSIKSNQSSGHKTSKESIGRSEEPNEINETVDALSVVFSDSSIKEKEIKKVSECVETNHYSGTETQDGNSDEGSYSQCDADGFREVRSKKTVKERQKDEKDKPSMQHSRIAPKCEKEPSVNVSSRNSKSTKSSNSVQIPQQQQQQSINISTSLVTNNLTTKTGKSQFERSRLRNLPPRLERQRENDRLHKTRLQGCDVNEMNKINQSVSLYTVKEGTPPAPIPQVNAWDKPITTQLRTTLDRETLNMAIDGRVDIDRAQHSGASSQRSSPNTDKSIGVHCQVQEKVMLDGSTPPVNTIIFENTNYKSAPGITGDLAIKGKFNTQMKNARIDKNRSGKSDDGDVDDVGVLSFNKPMSDMIGGKSDKPDPIQLPISFNKAEDSADMKLDFTFETELSRLTEDKNAKGLGLARSMHAITSAQNTISPSAAELNLKIASVKKVWENMPTVIEHTGEDNGVNSASSFASALDPANAFNKSSDPSDENHEVYSPSPSHNIQNAANNTTNVCKLLGPQVKPTQQQATSAVTHHVGAPSNSNQMGHVGASTVPTVATGGPGQPNHMGAAHTLSPPPMPVLSLGQPPQAYTGANQHINYQPSLGGNAQFGGISAIPSPPTVLFNNSGQMPTQGSLYNAFQMDQSRSQYSQYPPGPYGLGQTASSPYNTAQSMYLQTAPPHPPPNAQPPPDMYQSIPSQYRMATTGPFGQSQQINNNPSTVLISSTSNSLMSASVKPSSQQIGAIGTKAGAIGQTYGAQSQQGGQLYIPYDPSLQASYLQRGPGGPVQSSVVPAQMQASNSYYSASAGGQTGFYQQPGGSALQSAPLHQNSFGLQTNVFGGSVHGGSTAGTLQNFSSPFLSSPIQLATAAAALSAQQYRQPGTVSGLANPSGGVPTGAQQQSQQSVRPQQLKSPGSQNQQDMLTSVFNSASQIPSPKSRANCKQPPPQPSPTQHKYSSQYQNVGAQQSAQLVLQQQQSNRQQPNINMSVGAGSRGAQLAAGNQAMPQTHYPAPIQRPGAAFQPAPGSMSGGGGGGQRSLRGQQPGQQTRPHPTGQRQGQQQQQQQYYSGQGGNVSSQPDKGEESKLNETNSSNSTTNTSKNINSNSNVINKTSNSNSSVNSTGQNSETNKEVNVKNDGNASGKD